MAAHIPREYECDDAKNKKHIRIHIYIQKTHKFIYIFTHTSLAIEYVFVRLIIMALFAKVNVNHELELLPFSKQFSASLNK